MRLLSILVIALFLVSSIKGKSVSFESQEQEILNTPNQINNAKPEAPVKREMHIDVLLPDPEPLYFNEKMELNYDDWFY